MQNEDRKKSAKSKMGVGDNLRQFAFLLLPLTFCILHSAVIGRLGAAVGRIRATARSEAMAQTIVIFGASGDLTSRKLIPAIYSL
jgi:hypothetical protein